MISVLSVARNLLLLGGIGLFPPALHACTPTSLPGGELRALRDALDRCMRDRPGGFFRQCSSGNLIDIGGVDGFLIREYGEDLAGRMTLHSCARVLNGGLSMYYFEHYATSCRLQGRAIADTAYSIIQSDLESFCGVSKQEPTCRSQNGVVTETEIVDHRETGQASSQTTQETIDFHSDRGAVDFIRDLQSEIRGENRRNCAVLSIPVTGASVISGAGPLAGFLLGQAGGQACASASGNIQEFRAGDRLVRIKGEFTTGTGNTVTQRDTMLGFRRIDNEVEIIVLNRFANRPELDQFIEQELIEFLDRENAPCSDEGALRKD